MDAPGPEELPDPVEPEEPGLKVFCAVVVLV